MSSDTDIQYLKSSQYVNQPDILVYQYAIPIPIPIDWPKWSFIPTVIYG